jgi:hypothetical protein
MNRRKSRLWWLLGVVVVVAAVGYHCRPLEPLHAHSGDGEFTDLSWRSRFWGVFPVFDVRGFAVSMPGFDLGKDHTASYRVNHLPDIGRECMLYLAIDNPQDQWITRGEELRKLRGSLMLEVIDGDSKVIYHAQGSLSDYIWAWWNGKTLLYQLDALSFASRPSEEYTLRVIYHADPGLALYQGYCYLACGGRK